MKDINSKEDNADDISPQSDTQEINLDQFTFTSTGADASIGNGASSTSMPNFVPHDFGAAGDEQPQPGSQLVDLGMSESLPPYEVMEELYGLSLQTTLAIAQG